MNPARNLDLEKYLADAQRPSIVPRPHAPEVRDEDEQRDVASELWDYLEDFA
jgi:hypothetical protein